MFSGFGRKHANTDILNHRQSPTDSSRRGVLECILSQSCLSTPRSKKFPSIPNIPFSIIKHRISSRISFRPTCPHIHPPYILPSHIFASNCRPHSLIHTRRSPTHTSPKPPSSSPTSSSPQPQSPAPQSHTSSIAHTASSAHLSLLHLHPGLGFPHHKLGLRFVFAASCLGLKRRCGGRGGRDSKC